MSESLVIDYFSRFVRHAADRGFERAIKEFGKP
jgi:hypothetical protein